MRLLTDSAYRWLTVALVLGAAAGARAVAPDLASVLPTGGQAQIKIAPDCRLGEHHLRIRTETGLSELRTFFVGPYPVVAEQEPNNDLTNAQKVALNTTVTGVITSEDVDCFVVEARKGDRLSAEVEGMRLGRGFFRR